jgi:bifunctional non-homologous end joining protein LigD
VSKSEPRGSLREYRKKRKFSETPEPAGQKRSSESGRAFVVQKHRASRLHYDFRLEYDGVLKSWAVPKGPSADPSVKRLAMAVEDHPLDYADFEGVIPEGEYGGGTVMVWDAGRWRPEADSVGRALKKGELKFTLHGKKLKGSWVLVRTGRERSWLLIKHRDRHASEEDLEQTRPLSVLTKRTLEEIAEDEGGDAEKAASGDPKKIPRRSGVKRRGRGRRKSVWTSVS